MVVISHAAAADLATSKCARQLLAASQLSGPVWRGVISVQPVLVRRVGRP
jgi:hypothetical protein